MHYLGWVLVFCSVIVFAESSHSSSSAASRPSDVTSQVEYGVDAVMKNCFGEDQNWGKTQVKFSRVRKKYELSKGGLNKIFESTYLPAIIGVQNGYQRVKSLWSTNSKREEALRNIERISSWIKRESQLLPFDRWEQFRKGCMVLCVSANYLKYKERVATRLGGVAKMAETQEGVCTEFSRFAHYFAQRAGLKTKVVSNKANDHSFIGFYLNNKWYYADPGDATCEYFDPAL